MFCVSLFEKLAGLVVVPSPRLRQRISPLSAPDKDRVVNVVELHYPTTVLVLEIVGISIVSVNKRNNNTVNGVI